MSGSAAVCPRYHLAVELIGRRWTGAIIRGLLGGRARYNALRATIPDISDRMLSERLRELEMAGVLVRIVVPDAPVRVEYELTAKGRALEDAVEAIEKWAARWVTDRDLARSAELPDEKGARRKEPRPSARPSPRAGTPPAGGGRRRAG